jgi:hypothetical protein
MTTTHDEALVDLHHDILKLKDVMVPQPVKGAGRNCKPNRFVPSKRIKAMYRSPGLSLKAMARRVAKDRGETVESANEAAIARRWLASKGCRP